MTLAMTIPADAAIPRSALDFISGDTLSADTRSPAVDYDTMKQKNFEWL
jgi:hypothetical protein